MSDPANIQPDSALTLAANLSAYTRLAVSDGDMTPMAARIIGQIIDKHIGGQHE